VFNYTNASLAGGIWTLNNFTCNDSLNTIGNTSSYVFTVDTTAPTSLNVTVGTPSSSGVAVYFTANEAISSINLSYGTSTALGSSSLSSADNVSSGSVSLSGLSASTLYYVNVTAYDRAGNSVTNGTFNFTTGAAATEETDDGNPGGSEYGTYIIKEFQLKAGYTKYFAKNGALKFTLNNQSHSMTVKDITNTTITISVASTPQTATLSVGEEKKFDLTGDGVYDLSIKLNRISINKLASITLKSISEAMLPPAAGGEEEAAGAGAEATSEKSNAWMWVIVIIVIAIVAVYFIVRSYLKFRKIR
jgi:hypothetical protein